MSRWLLFCILPHLTFCCFWHTEFRFKFFGKIHLLERSIHCIKVVGFVLKKILTYFEMLIVPHALHCVDCCFLYLPHLTQSGILFWFQCPPPPPSPNFFTDVASLLKCLPESSQSCRINPQSHPPPPPLPNFLSDLVLAPSSLHQPPPDKGHTVREYY